jgi:hypothetical protein
MHGVHADKLTKGSAVGRFLTLLNRKAIKSLLDIALKLAQEGATRDIQG